jgi:hypothetical protein
MADNSFYVGYPKNIGDSGGSGGLPNEPYIVYSSDANLPNSLVLQAGANITLTPAAGALIIASNSASNNASFATVNFEPGLPSARQLQAGNGITIVDNGAGTTVTIGISNTVLGASFLTVNPEVILTGERQLVAGPGITFTDNGPNSTFVIQSSGASVASNPSQRDTTGTITLSASSNRIRFADASAGPITYNLPSAGSSLDVTYKIKRVDNNLGNTVQILPNGADTIDNFTVFNLVIQYQSIDIWANVNWNVV